MAILSDTSLFSVMRTVLSVLFLLVLLSAMTGAESVKEKPWECEVREERYAVFSRDSVDDSVSEIKSWALMTGTVREAIDIIMSTAEYPRMFENILHTEVLAKDDSCEVVYSVLDVPVISDRDYVVRACVIDLSDRLGTVTWNAVKHPEKPPRDDMVRVTVNRGYWNVEQVESDEIRVTYFVHVDAGGMLPKFIQNIVNTRAVPDTLFSIYREIMRRRKHGAE